MGLIGGLVGALLGAWCAVAFPRAASRRQVALQLLERYTSPDFFIARAETWRIRHAWAHGDRSCLAFFIRTDETVNSPDAESRCANGLTPHQNLSWLLHFFVSVQAYEEAGLLDARLAATLLGPHYAWYREFFQCFCEEYRRQAPSGQIEPSWVSSLPKLEVLFRKAAQPSATASSRSSRPDIAESSQLS